MLLILASVWDILFCFVFHFSSSGECIRVSHCDFNLHFPDD